MKTDIFLFLQHRQKIKFNRKVFVFIVCLIISFFSWLQINLSKSYFYNLPVRIDFVNFPKAKFVSSKISDTLYVEVQADGYGLLKYKMKNVSVDFKKLKKDNISDAYYFLPGNFTKTISKQMGDNLKLVHANTDTLEVDPILK